MGGRVHVEDEVPSVAEWTGNLGEVVFERTRRIDVAVAYPRRRLFDQVVTFTNCAVD